MSGKKTLPLMFLWFFGILFPVFFSLFPGHIRAQYACPGICVPSCSAGYSERAGDCVDPDICCVSDLEPTWTPRDELPIPTGYQGSGCCSTSVCTCPTPSQSRTCHGVGPGCSPAGTCYCSDPDPIGSCTGWGACTLQYNGWYCQTQTCDAGCTCDKSYSSYEGTNYHRDCFI